MRWFPKLIYLILIGSAFMFVLLYMPNFSVYLFVTILVILVILFLMAHWSGVHISAELVMPTEPIAPGEPFSCTVVLHNTSFLPVGTVRVTLQSTHVTLQESVSFYLHGVIPSRGTARLNCTMTSAHCGQVKVDLTCIRIFDWLRLFSHGNRKKVEPAMMEVLPCVTDPPEAFLQKQEESDAPMKPTTEPEEFLGIRDYREGDRIRSIHWKLSSRFTDPVVREYGIPEKTGVTVFLAYALLPGYTDRGQRLDAILEAVTALTRICCTNQQILTLLICSDCDCQNYTITAEDELPNILRAVLQAPPQDTPEACRQSLIRSGYHAMLQIADTPNGMTIQSLASQTGNILQLLIPGTAAETVYRLMQVTSAL